jgi:hypothetical protein
VLFDYGSEATVGSKAGLVLAVSRYGQMYNSGFFASRTFWCLTECKARGKMEIVRLVARQLVSVREAY